MTLSPGTQLGAYEIVVLIGAGGMGEVYRGRDTRLDRMVAIKILPAALAGDAGLRDRFEREARAISSSATRTARQGAPLGYRPSRSQTRKRDAHQGRGETARLRPREERRAGRRDRRPLHAADDAREPHCAGTILGTFQHMAPEQIEGFEADARTDIFAFNALLFEMLTGAPVSRSIQCGLANRACGRSS